MKIKPLIGERSTMRDRLPGWARYRIYVRLAAGLLFLMVSTVTWILAGPSSSELKEALVTALFILPGIALVVGLAIWYTKSRRPGN